MWPDVDWDQQTGIHVFTNEHSDSHAGIWLKVSILTFWKLLFHFFGWDSTPVMSIRSRKQKLHTAQVKGDTKMNSTSLFCPSSGISSYVFTSDCSWLWLHSWVQTNQSVRSLIIRYGVYVTATLAAPREKLPTTGIDLANTNSILITLLRVSASSERQIICLTDEGGDEKLISTFTNHTRRQKSRVASGGYFHGKWCQKCV